MRLDNSLKYIFFFMAIGLMIGGCGKDSGTIIISPNPSSQSFSWSLTGPDSVITNGAGPDTLIDYPVGNYSIVWKQSPDWYMPYLLPQTLKVDSTLTFCGSYLPLPEPTTEFVLIPPFPLSMPMTFAMGQPELRPSSYRPVTLTNPFFMAKGAVTRKQYLDVMVWALDNGYIKMQYGLPVLCGEEKIKLFGSSVPNRERFYYEDGLLHTNNPDWPMTYLTWFGAAIYCDWLNRKEGLPLSYSPIKWSPDTKQLFKGHSGYEEWVCNDGDPYNAAGYRLPTEAEWEFACRAGTTTRYYFGDCLPGMDKANLDYGSSSDSCPGVEFSFRRGSLSIAGEYPPNEWGLFDMHGNVWEYCNDVQNFPKTEIVNPTGGKHHRYYYDSRVIKGGAYSDPGYAARSGFSHDTKPDSGTGQCGLRIVRSTQPKTKPTKSSVMNK